MIKQAYFENVPECGNLYRDYVLHYDDQLILFLLKDANDSLYLCVCSELLFSGRRWFISKISLKNLRTMIRNEESVKNIFLKGDKTIEAIKEHGSSQVSYRGKPVSNISPDLLPQDDFFLDMDSEERELFERLYF